MIIDLRSITLHSSRRYDLSLEEDWWRPNRQDDQVLGFDAPLRAKIEIYRTSDKYVLAGDMNGGLKVKCDRCLEAYHRDLDSSFKVFLVLPTPDTDKAEIELQKEDMAVEFIKGEEIDLDEIIQEQVYLSLPIKSLCSDSCSGLCAKCGSNLNNGDCRCKKETGHPGFSKLNNLINEGA